MSPDPEIQKAGEPQAGRELDAVVAKRVFGFIWVKHRLDSHSETPGQRYLVPSWGAFEERFCDRADGSEPQWQGDSGIVPYYSTDLSAAWRVVEKIGRAAEIRWHPLVPPNERVSVSLGVYDPPGGVAEGETLPLAICRAALLAVDGTKGKP